jgi:hypothetical protein
MTMQYCMHTREIPTVAMVPKTTIRPAVIGREATSPPRGEYILSYITNPPRRRSGSKHEGDRSPCSPSDWAERSRRISFSCRHTRRVPKRWLACLPAESHRRFRNMQDCECIHKLPCCLQSRRSSSVLWEWREAV